MNDKNVEKIKKYLKTFGTKEYRKKKYNQYVALIQKNKTLCIDNKNYDRAKEYLLLQSIIEAQHLYLKSFKLLSKKNHIRAWSSIIDVEDILKSIKPYIKDFNIYKLDLIEDKNKKIQTLFPHHMFLSSGFIAKKVICSICGKEVSIKNFCGHRKGEIYQGKWCSHICTEAKEFDHIALVENPRDKRCIITNFDGEPPNYKLINRFISIIKYPYISWDLKWSKKRHPHENFKHIKENDICPCNSEQTYRDCCLKEKGVLMSHVDFIGPDFAGLQDQIHYHY